MMHRLFIDTDSTPYLRENYMMYVPKREIWETLQDTLEMEIRRLQGLFPQLGRGLILKSSDAHYLVRFPDSKLTWEEVEAIQCLTRMIHRGYRYFVFLVEDQTLRIEPKPDKTHKPYVVKIVE